MQLLNVVVDVVRKVAERNTTSHCLIAEWDFHGMSLSSKIFVIKKIMGKFGQVSQGVSRESL